MDKEKVVRYHRDHEYKTKVKRKRSEHEKFKKEFFAHQKDVQRNLTYDPRTGCATEPQEKSVCKHARFGYKGKKGYKTEQRQHCDYYKDKLGTLSTLEAQTKWLLENENNGSETGKLNKKRCTCNKFYISKSKSVLFRYIKLTIGP